MRPRPIWLDACVVGALLAASCAAPPPPASPAPEPAPPARVERADPVPPAPATRDLPPRWDTIDVLSFERLVDDLAAAGPVRWSEPAHEAFAAALARADLTSVRAAVLLGLDRSDRSTETLLARLEMRERAPSRARNGGDVVAAAALEGRLDKEQRARMLALSIERHPHPDLEVRVECARVSLLAGNEAVIPFLLRVLRVQTPDQHLDPPDWEPVTTLFWAKHRAAEALSARAKLPMRFRPDASFADQAAEAARLAEALGHGAAER